MSSDFGRATDFDSDHQQHSAQSEMAGPVAETAAALPPSVLTAQGRGNAVQRQIAIQRMQQTHGNRAVQRAIALQRSLGEEGGMQDNLGARIQARAGGGSPLDSGIQRQAESHLGASLSGVRIHNDPEAHQMTQAANAHAFTTGNDIYLSANAPAVGTPEGDSMHIHELSHVVQQNAGPVSGTPTGGGVSVSDPSDSYEQAAEQSAATFMTNRSSASQSAAVQTMRVGSMPAVQRSADEAVPIQTMRIGSMPAVQREAAEEEEPVQTMRVGSMPAVQRCPAEDEQRV